MNKKENQAAIEAHEKLMSVDPYDPESAHGKADEIILEFIKKVASPVYDAYIDIQKSCSWWGTG